MAAEPVKLLWTGGWDSTFRLLQWVVGQKKPIQPYYLLDPGRQSTAAELHTMRRIKDRIFERFPEARPLICPTVFGDILDIPAMPDVTKSLERLRQRYGHLGSQYDWLARYCRLMDLDGIELGLTRDGTPHKILAPLVAASQEGDEQTWRVGPHAAGSDEDLLFRWYRFPFFELTKKDMERMAQQEGMMDLMEMTWFCHSPRANFQPCGVCVPCRFTIQEGLGRRVPWQGRLRYYTNLRLQTQRKPGLYETVRRIKRQVGMK